MPITGNNLVRRFGRKRFQIKTRNLNLANRKIEEELLRDLGLQEIFNGSYATTGVNAGDYGFLFHYVRETKPRKVIEFGTGKSTWVLAKAMESHCLDLYNGEIALVSMEEEPKWHQQQLEHFPFDKIRGSRDFVRLVRSDTEEIRERYIIGRSYTETPLEQFDFCFVDGPNPRGTCNMDAIKLLRQAEGKINCLLDNRKTTQIAYAALLGQSKMIRYHNGLCLFAGLGREDLEVKDVDARQEEIIRDRPIPLDLRARFNL